MDTSQLPEHCPKCGEPNPHSYNVNNYYWRTLYCIGGCGHGAVGAHPRIGEHLYVRCYCGHDFGFRPTEDSKEKPIAA